MKKYLLSLLLSVFVLTAAASAVDAGLFPAPYTGTDGVTRWGYLDETGAQQVGYFYAEAEPFNEYGFAVVTNARGERGVIDGTGRTVIECREAPRAVEFAEGAIAFRYADHSIYYDASGKETGDYEGAAGFFSGGLLRVQRDGRWGYVNEAGELAVAARYAAAGDFSNGRALVQDADGTFSVLFAGGTRSGLPAEPAALEIYPNSLIVLKEGSGYRLYSLETGSYVTEAYDEMQVHDDGYVMVQLDKKWGILTAKGKVSVPIQYYYMSYMGEGAYAARGAAGTSVEAIEGSGAMIYFTDTYVGGFETFRFGQSWHGTMDGGIMFFNKNGVLSRKLDGASNPVILTDDVARVTVEGAQRYVRLSDGKVLYAPVRAYTLDNGVKVTTKTYEKYLGMQDGTEFGWNLEYPQFSGMTDTAAQKKINEAVEKFFLDGPSLPAQRQSLVGSYGFAIYGRVLVVYADAKLGLGVGATVWNDNIALDLGSGAQYTVTGDLFQKKFEDTVIAALPEGTPYYLYSYPRMTADGVVYYLNHAQTEDVAPYTEEFKVYYNQVWDVVDSEGACYRALTATGESGTKQPQTAEELVPAFSDVPAAHWARAYIEDAAKRGLMKGADGKFQPDQPITASEAVVTVARALSLPEGSAPGIAGVWYAGEYGGAYQAGVLAGMDGLDPEARLTRGDAMQLFANALRRDTNATLNDAETRTVLGAFPDALDLTPARREAAAWCVKNNVIAGSDGKLLPNATLTRAEFAKLLTAIK